MSPGKHPPRGAVVNPENQLREDDNLKVPVELLSWCRTLVGWPLPGCRPRARRRHVQVVVRIRPLNERETTAGDAVAVTVAQDDPSAVQACSAYAGDQGRPAQLLEPGQHELRHARRSPLDPDSHFRARVTH